MAKKAIIIGAGPAGLTAAYELLKRTDIKPIILEKSGDIGGISKTINYKGNRMDMGPHRFFSKSDRVMNWWLNIMPLQETAEESTTIAYQNKKREINTNGKNAGAGNDKVMLLIQRLTRIYFLRKFFAYPIKLSIDTLRTLGLIRTIKIMFSFLWIRLFPRKPEKSLEDFIINKFGKELYLLFFKDYTEKVWGVPCHEISAEWGAQRIKGVSLSKAIGEAIKSLGKKKGGDIGQKGKETSLIEQFLYPKYGPGSLWEEVAGQVEAMGGKIYFNQNVTKFYFEDNRIVGVNTINGETNQAGAWEGDYFFSTMPVKELIAGMDDGTGIVPEDVLQVAAGLEYRDFINVGILLKQLSKPVANGQYEKLELKDNWIYIQERDVKVGRLMIYNNWGDGMIKDPTTTWIGMEYFCNKTDDFWALPDKAIERIAIEELIKMELARVEDVLDSTVRRMEKTYPAYFGTYDQFDKVKDYINHFENLFLVGRNGMHKYNNADHSMLTAMVAVDNICEGVTSKENIWAINTEQEYHEVKKSGSAEKAPAREQQPAPVATPQAEPAFRHFILHQHRKLLGIAIALSILQFLVFKFMYPHANFMFDSYVYLDAAIRSLDINFWPIGYSKFLRLVNIFSHSDLVLVTIQYITLQGALLYFLFTILYFLKPGNVVKWLLLLFFCVNPAYLSISNYVLSDGIFSGLSIVWFTQLLWIMFKPSKKLIIIHAILLFALFTIRYNALYYPFISGLVILFSKFQWRIKLISYGLTLALIGSFISTTSMYYKQLTGKRQFSAFSGWMLANNALIMYRNLPMNGELKRTPAKFQRLHQLVVTHLDSLNHLTIRPDSSAQLYYMWIKSSPLRRYLAEQYPNDHTDYSFRSWASVGPLYGEYAKYLILKHPIDYAKYYLLQNVIWYSVPHQEFLGTYNLNSDTVEQSAMNWFHYKSNKLQAVNKNIKPIKAYSWIMAIINVMFFFMFIGALLFNLNKVAGERFKKAVNLAILVWIINLLFSLVSAPVMLRYELFAMALLFSFGSLIFEFLLKVGNQLQAEEALKKLELNKPSIA
jgi:protoporphyrinogen oxidase